MVSVTVISSLYNPGTRLAPFLDRLERTIDDDHEIVIVDDASTDGSTTQLLEWAEPRGNVTVCVNPRNLGVAASRNIALARARGEYVWFTDHDDRWDDAVVRRLHAAAGGADMVICRARLYHGDDGDVPGRIVDGVDRDARIDREDLLRAMLRGEIHGFLWTKLIRRAALGDDPFPAQATQSDFVGLVGAVSRVDEVQLIPDVLYSYVVRPDSLTRVREPQLANLERAHAAMMRACTRAGVDDGAELDFFTAWFLAWALIATPARWRASRSTRREGAELARRMTAGMPLRRLIARRPALAILALNRMHPRLATTAARIGYRAHDGVRRLTSSRAEKRDAAAPVARNRVAYIRVEDPEYPRNRRIHAFLERDGNAEIEVVPRATGGTLPGRLLRDIRRAAAAARRADTMIVAEFSLTQVPILWALARLGGCTLIVDGFVGKYETEVEDWKSARPGSLRARQCAWIDRTAFRLADVFLIDTDARAHALRGKHGDRTPVVVLPVGAPEWAKPAALPAREDDAPLRILFYGSFLPLHGLPTMIAGVAAVGRDVSLTLVGTDRGGEIASLAERLGVGDVCTFVPPVPESALLATIHEHDVVLGIFGDSPKARTVIANKVWQGLAAGRTVITRQSPALAEIRQIVNKQLIEVSSAEELAQAIESWEPTAESPDADIRLEAYVRERFGELQRRITASRTG